MVLRASAASAARSLTDCAALPGGVLMPWVGFGTYRLGKSAREATLAALNLGYRMIDTAYIYSNEKTEGEVGKALATAFAEGLRREEVFVVTKHWRKYHGYAPALGCLQRSLSRLQLDQVDLWLMHWPGPAWTSMAREASQIEEHGAWHYAADGMGEHEMPSLRAETWRAMEEALQSGRARAIGVSNFSIRHLEELKRTAKVWPPAVNQVECHPKYPQTELRAYCEREGIVVQAYASLGGQDASKGKWASIGGPLLEATPVLAAAAERPGATASQVLLRWALHRGAAVIPKTSSAERMRENAGALGFELGDDELAAIDGLADGVGDEGRLCWRADPLRMLDFK